MFEELPGGCWGRRRFSEGEAKQVSGGGGGGLCRAWQISVKDFGF